jgi:hypothetical protein
MGLVLAARGDAAGADRMLERAIEIETEDGRRDGPEVGDILVDWGTVLLEQGRASEALDRFRHGRDIRAERLGPDTAACLDSELGVAASLLARGDRETASETLIAVIRALEGREGIYAEKQRERARALLTATS